MYYFIVNPLSSSGNGKSIWKSCAEYLSRSNVEYKVFFTRYAGHAILIAQNLSTKYTPCTIVAVGGDGTANEVICGLKNYSQIQFGYIPSGSGNDMARGLGLSTDPLKALHSILHPNLIKNISIGRVYSNNCDRNFIVSSGFGFDAAVCHVAEHSPVKKILNRLHLGKLTYLGIALKEIIMADFPSVTVTIDDQTSIHYNGILFLSAMNLKYEGGGFMFCPDANAEDDILDFILVEKMSKLKILLLLPTALFGKHTRYKGVQILHCKKIQVHCAKHLAVHTDGEPICHATDLTYELGKIQLPVILH